MLLSETIELKALFGIIAVALTFVGYIPYLHGIINGKTRPHIFSWLIWLLDDCVIFALQFTHGAGPGSFVILSAGLLSVVVLILTLRHKGKQDITPSDIVFSILAIAALVLWIFAKQPLISTLLIIAVNMFALMPTIRKSWHKPHSENATFYAINTVRFILTLLALQTYTLITALHPTTWLFVNGLFALMLILRRKKLYE